MPKYGHTPWVSPEGLDVPLNPLQGCDLVHEAIVPWGEEKYTKAGTKPPLHDLVNTTLIPHEGVNHMVMARVDLEEIH